MGAGYRNISSSIISSLPSMDSTWAPDLGTSHPHEDDPGHIFVHVAEAAIQPIILAIGIILNIISLLVLKRTHIGGVFKICITALTISDLCASLFGFSQILVEVIAFNGDIPFGYYHPEAIASHTLYFLFIMFMCTSSGIVILIVVIRSVMVSKPMSSRKYLTSKKVKIFCAVIFFITFVLFLPTGFNIMWEVCYHDFYQNDICPQFENKRWVLKYLYALTIIYGPVLLITYIICFILIKINLAKANKDAESMMNSEINSNEIRTRMQQTLKITRILLAILVLDCICVLPTCLQGVGLIISPDDFVFDKTYALANVIDVICEIFLCCRPTVNFLIYVCMHKEFRRQCGVLFGRGKLWAQGALSDIAPSGIRKSSTDKIMHNVQRQSKGDALGGSNLTITQTTESMQLTPLANKKEYVQETTSLLAKDDTVVHISDETVNHNEPQSDDIMIHGESSQSRPNGESATFKEVNSVVT